MNLYLMRHAASVEPEEAIEDSQRPLSGKGRQKLKAINRSLAKLDLTFDMILASPYLRARQTADAVADALGIPRDRVIESENLIPPGRADKLIEEIHARESASNIKENILIVGHEPFLGQLIGILLAGDAGVNIHMRKAGLCKLSVEKLSCGKCACLEWLMTPSQLTAV